MSRSVMRMVWVILSMLLLVGGAVQAQGNPADVVSAFLERWSNRDYAGMYGLISPSSRQQYTQPVFAAIYENADIATGMTGLSYTIHDTHMQGTSAAVTYDVLMESSLFGIVPDSDRIMRLVQTPEGWRVAWSSMDIFDGLAAGSQIRSVGRRGARANIYDRDGDVLVEQGGTVVALYVQRQSVPNEAVCLDLMAELLRRQRQDLADFFNRYLGDAVFYVGEIDADVDALRGAELDEFCAVRRLERETRRYHRGNAVAHVTGYIGQIPADELPAWQERGYQSGDLIGRLGIEAAYETELSGQAERVLRVVEPGGTVVRELAAAEGTPPLPVMLTIDRDLQVAVAQALADAYNYAEGNWGGRDVSTGAAAVVLDVNTGAILAMSSFPLYEPDLFNPDTFCCTLLPAGERIAQMINDTRTPMFNRAVQGQYSPGSIYKIVTTAAAAETGTFGPNDIFECGLTWNGAPFGDNVGFERADWRLTDGLEAAGPITMSQALTSSCDPFYYEMGALLFNERPSLLVDFSQQMGLGRLTGVNFFGPEAQGQLPVPANVSEAINNAIGQGDVKTNPLHFAELVAGVANGGTLYKPYLVQQVGGMDNTPVTFTAEPEARGDMGLSNMALNVIREGMCNVTTDEELGTAVWVFEGANYLACGKTGTAQTSRYPNAWFVAYAPAEDPQIAVLVMAEQSREGSEVAAPIARRIIDYYLGEPWPGYPLWWNEEPYIPLEIPEGMTGGG